MNSERLLRWNRLGVLLALAGSLAVWPVRAQPTLDATSPTDGATGVSMTTTIVFTFSEEMDTNVTEATFFLISPLTFYGTTPSWNVGHTILTCTPLSPFPANKTIYWTVNGANTNGDTVDGFGSFTTSSGGGGGSGTNATTTFSVGKVHHYLQSSAGAPTLDPLTPYGFSGVTSLASNRTATSVTLTNPIGGFFDLYHLPPPSAEIFLLATNFTSLSTFDATFPPGNYGFFVQAPTSNQIVVVALPTASSLPQPNAPRLTNYVAAQAVNPNQPFVLGWDAFTGGGVTNYIDVDVDGAINSPEPGQPGWLNGTARTFTIPAGTLLPNSTYAARIGFFQFSGTTNASFATAAYRATYTEFSLTTSGGATGSLVLTNAAYAPANFSFDVLCPVGMPVTVEYKTNLSSAVWHTLLTTNNPPNRFRAIAPQSTTNRHLFFRARIGS